MTSTRPYSEAIERLKAVGLRPTRQRMALARLLFEGPDRHITAEMLHDEAARENVRVSLATVYNTLHQFTEAGLLREVVVEPSRSYFDTNTTNHYHFFNTTTATLLDISDDSVKFSGLPDAPVGTEIERVDIIIRVK